MKALSCLLSLALVAAASTPSLASATIETTATGVSAGGARLGVGTSVEGLTRVVVAKGRAGQVTILRYDDGCTVSLRPGQVYTVLNQSPCAPSEPTTPPQAEATGLGGIGATAVVGVVVAGAIAGGVIAATSGKGSNNNPIYISP